MERRSGGGGWSSRVERSGVATSLPSPVRDGLELELEDRRRLKSEVSHRDRVDKSG